METTDMEIEQAQANLMRKREILGIKPREDIATLRPVNEDTLQEIEERMLANIAKPEPEIFQTRCLILSDYASAEDFKRCECPSCKSRRDKEAKELQEQREHPEKVLAYWGIPRGYISKSFENFFEHGESLKNVCTEVSRKEKNVLLYGNTGSGKTHLAVAIIRHKVQISKEIFETWNYHDKRPAIFVSVPELLLEVRTTFQKGAELTEADVIKKYQEVPLLILDDMGAERDTPWATSTLYLIIDHRDKNNLWTIITSNLSLEEIEQIHGARIASRLSNMNIIHCKFPDYRRKRFHNPGDNQS